MTKKQLIELAKNRQIKGYSNAAKQPGKDALINLINQDDNEMNQTVETTETTETINEIWTYELKETQTIPSPQEFFAKVKDLDDKVEVSRACNELLDLLAEKYTIATISKKLTAYKKPFYGFIHPTNEKLNEFNETKDGNKKQHIAANLLCLDDDQGEELKKNRLESENERLGYDADGEIRNVDIDSKSIKGIIEKALSLLESNEPEKISAGILPLIGLRRNEIHMNSIQTEYGILYREWKIVGKYLIAIKGISKKKGDENWFVRPTLVPAERLVIAQLKFLSYREIQELAPVYKTYDESAFRKRFDRFFKKTWENEFSTIEAYDNSGKRIKNNATSHKCRAFYIWALIPVLKSMNFNSNQAKKYLQECLAHDDSKDTEKYFVRYDEFQFDNPVKIDIPSSKNKVGLVDSRKVEELRIIYETEVGKEVPQITVEFIKNLPMFTIKTETENQTAEIENEPVEVSNSTVKFSQFNLNEFIENIPNNLQPEFQKMINGGMDVTKALIKIVELASVKSESKEVEVIEEKEPISDDYVEIVLSAIMEYNSNQPENELMVVPTYGLVNSIYQAAYGREVYRKIYSRVWELKKNDIGERLENRGIKFKEKISKTGEVVLTQEFHNYIHRGKIKPIIDKIVEIIKENYQ